MPSTTGTIIAKAAFQILNVDMPGEALGSADAATVLEFLNDFLDELTIRGPLFAPFISRERFDLVADQGGPDDPYTIGDGGDFDTDRPATQNAIVAANLILTDPDPEVRVPLGLYTDSAYDANQIPDQSNTQPTGLYYNATYASDLGSIFLWPVPDTAENDLELFLQKQVAQFADVNTTYYIPSGWPRMLKYNLADMLQDVYGKQLTPRSQQIAVNTLSSVKRSNARLTDLSNDAYVFTQGRRTLYNLNTGSGG